MEFNLMVAAGFVHCPKSLVIEHPFAIQISLNKHLGNRVDELAAYMLSVKRTYSYLILNGLIFEHHTINADSDQIIILRKFMLGHCEVWFLAIINAESVFSKYSGVEGCYTYFEVRGKV
jgi:hypothetical protein